MIYGNNMIDGDDGSHPFSPKYMEKRQTIELQCCSLCGRYFENGLVVNIDKIDEDEYNLHIEDIVCDECQNDDN